MNNITYINPKTNTYTSASKSDTVTKKNNFVESYSRNTEQSTIGSNSMVGSKNTDIYDMYKYMSSNYSIHRENTEGTGDEAVNLADNVTTYYDKQSGETFEFVPTESGAFFQSKEAFDKFNELYPMGSNIHRYKISEMKGNAKTINGVPVETMPRLPNGYCIIVYDSDFNIVETREVPEENNELDADLFFEKLESFMKDHDIYADGFWDEFFSKK